ncbi:hypothetical protein DFQ28_009125 [Apophysomyces sp. BC1034]|nr:hypothetical protein DFQ30_002588 [Apophysomyces sp. BC1015]KAG0173726.1 hypothetical protein DFQ29_007786 [Apophysomyces sp. BC1021]KAG0185572.1 hypothetical protein DFQ28_009125 [Apophysomyces sp. BC1034]
MHPLLNKLAPSAFTLKNQHNVDVNLADIIGKGKRSLVLFFYPKDNTFGCTKEACSFRDQFEDLSRLEADVIGVSSDSVESHKRFAEQHKLPYTLLADTEGELRQAYQVPKWYFGMPGRTTYIIGKDGTIKDVLDSQVLFAQHVSNALKILEKGKA